ncbi:MAG TPA: LL-diaminopimelate aminotransferase [Sulfurovum sp.]|jgi:alanine-synthesizing transaminase|nr:MAG: alanine transaminase [Sulfurovum sp. 35-42-20]OYY57627.1 MAG: alanine transaminase [Sulfurovum sp. 28-43-6]OYZ26279.1 MAG: alanine transaminase [Sulfurovum sp. 16-42-52]OYZ49956.1 MAG: alanine transaminase [Sulfurovum sp. 24-42-9]OZA46543.1 MAG: alanine transaminase [Sulfurovum sp. 17-42-90]OZA59950.1 MAG: alanine transaminase [Sulfurovum sp. 39-42-12]HQR73563.1 LL-diaminopimelate aminotransferase [Sulfurovum sp.]
MFDEIQFEKINRLPKYLFAEINEIKMQLRRDGIDIIDFSMGNPDASTPQPIIDKLCETAQKPKTHGYSASKGIYKLRLAMAKWYKRKYDVDLDPDTEIVATMGSKEGYVHLVQAISNPGDVAIVPDPTYPIHSQAFILAGANVEKMQLIFDEETFVVDEDRFLADVEDSLNNSMPQAKFLVVNFPHNPTTATVTPQFYERLVALAREKRFYIISDIAYADITFDGYKTPSIMSVEGAKDVAVECYTLSKSYNMAGWRVGFIVGNKRLIGALQSIKSWLDYGMFTPIQVAATVALDEYGYIPEEQIIPRYEKRRDVMIEAFTNAGWRLAKPNASMFIWAKIPEIARDMGSLEFAKQLLLHAGVAVSPGIGFGKYGDEYVRIALIENENRIRQAARNIKKFLKDLEEAKK